jgi:hypothetical protein
LTPLKTSLQVERSARTEPGAKGAETKGQQSQNADRSSYKRHTHQLLTALLTPDLDRLAAVQRKNSKISF